MVKLNPYMITKVFGFKLQSGRQELEKVGFREGVNLPRYRSRRHPVGSSKSFSSSRVTSETFESKYLSSSLRVTRDGSWVSPLLWLLLYRELLYVSSVPFPLPVPPVVVYSLVYETLSLWRRNPTSEKQYQTPSSVFVKLRYLITSN